MEKSGQSRVTPQKNLKKTLDTHNHKLILAHSFIIETTGCSGFSFKTY